MCVSVRERESMPVCLSTVRYNKELWFHFRIIPHANDGFVASAACTLPVHVSVCARERDDTLHMWFSGCISACIAALTYACVIAVSLWLRLCVSD